MVRPAVDMGDDEAQAPWSERLPEVVRRSNDPLGYEGFSSKTRNRNRSSELIHSP